MKAVSFEEDTPKIDPNIVFLYLEEFRAYFSELKGKIKNKKNKTTTEVLKLTRKHVKLLVDYLDKDYEGVKKSLHPLLKAGKITFDIAWALFKSNDILYTSAYGHEQEARAVQVEMVTKVSIVHRFN